MSLFIVSLIASILVCFVFYKRKGFNTFKTYSFFLCATLLIIYVNSLKPQSCILSEKALELYYTAMSSLVFVFKAYVDWVIITSDSHDDNIITIATFFFLFLNVALFFLEYFS